MGSADVGEPLVVIGGGREVARRQIPNVFVTATSTSSVNKVPIRLLDIGSQFSEHDVMPKSNGNGDEILLDGQPHPGNLPSRNGAQEFLDAAIRDADLTSNIPRTARPLPSVISDLGDGLFLDQGHVDEDDHDKSPGELYENLVKATKHVPGSSGSDSFIPIPEIMKLINPASIVKSLERPRSGSRGIRHLHSPPETSSTSSDQLEVPMKEKLHDRFSNVKDHAYVILDPEGMAKEICGIRQVAHTEKASSEKTASPACYYQRIFAILVLIEQPRKIRRFLKDKVCDADLPLTLHHGKMYRRKDKENKRPLGCFEGWKSLLTKKFDDTQWQVKAPFLSTSSNREKPVHHFIVPRKGILPLTFKERIGRGAHGEVFKVRIHAGHQGFSRDQDKFFALKRLLKRTPEALSTEAMIPKLLSRSKHSNIIPLLATLEHNETRYLLFDWAETDLSKYWLEDKPQPTVNSVKKTVLWMARECAGIASGLTQIHGPYKIGTDDSFQILNGSLPHTDSFKDQLIAECRQIHQSQLTNKIPGQGENIFELCPRHGDIKASNVLLDHSSHLKLSEDTGDPDYTIKISDFGLAGFGDINNPTVRTTPAYAAPETEIEPIVHGNSCDIWALGCLYLEFITWHFGGKELLKEFVNERGGDGTFFEILITAEAPVKDTEFPRRVAVVKKAVVEFIEKLRHHNRCSQYFSDFLGLIQQGMLVVEDETHEGKNGEAGNGGGVNTRGRRKKSCQVGEELQSMYKKCLDSEVYAIKCLN